MRAGLLALLLLGCSSSGEPTSSEPAPESHGTVTELPDEPIIPEVPLEPDSECGRALACCQAYARSIPNVVASSACVGPSEAARMPDASERCRRMRAGWREALEHHPSESPPEACR